MNDFAEKLEQLPELTEEERLSALDGQIGGFQISYDDGPFQEPPDIYREYPAVKLTNTCDHIQEMAESIVSDPNFHDASKLTVRFEGTTYVPGMGIDNDQNGFFDKMPRELADRTFEIELTGDGITDFMAIQDAMKANLEDLLTFEGQMKKAGFYDYDGAPQPVETEGWWADSNTFEHRGECLAM